MKEFAFTSSYAELYFDIRSSILVGLYEFINLGPLAECLEQVFILDTDGSITPFFAYICLTCSSFLAILTFLTAIQEFKFKQMKEGVRI